MFDNSNAIIITFNGTLLGSIHFSSTRSPHHAVHVPIDIQLWWYPECAFDPFPNEFAVREHALTRVFNI